jgi:hypothetical protein
VGVAGDCSGPRVTVGLGIGDAGVLWSGIGGGRTGTATFQFEGLVITGSGPLPQRPAKAPIPASAAPVEATVRQRTGRR